MAFKPLPRPIRDEDVSFAPKQLELLAKPVGLVADTLNNFHMDRHRGSRHTVENYFLHVSDLIAANATRKFCAREHVLTLVEDRGTNRMRSISPGMALIHTQGHAIQEHITNYFIEYSPHGNKVWGDWECPCEFTRQKFSFKPPGAVTCTKCNQPLTIYKEIGIAYEDYLVAGHPDLIIVWNNIMHLYEIKSIDRKDVDFETMDAPLGDHTIQTTMYYWIMKAIRRRESEANAANPGSTPVTLPYDIDPYINYIYADRSSNLFRRNYYKEFTKRASSLSRIEPMLANAQAVKDGITQRKLPPRLSICTGVQSSRAKNCNCAIACFMRNSNVLV